MLRPRAHAPGRVGLYIEPVVLPQPGAGTIRVKLATGGRLIAGTQNDISFDVSVRVKAGPDGLPACRPNADIGKELTLFAFLPPGCSGTACTGMRALVASQSNVDPIPDGAVLYTCDITATGSGTLALSRARASDPSGLSIASFTAFEGRACLLEDAILLRTPTPTRTPSATRTPTPTPSCAGDCDRNAVVTIDEIILMVNIALDLRPTSACRPGDANGDGRVTVEEIILAVTKALGRC
ncbi:MAG: hypothetical protein N3C12_07260 [Candidatus Binatia bacterium]|nr:hypothetical protein [Candidatus Binatia bacterium]